MSAAGLIRKLVSGGQSGVDRAALDLALELGIPCGGWCPKGRWAEDGLIDGRYPLKETPSEDVTQRTEWNVRDSHGTLIIAPGELRGGTKLTYELAQRYGRPTMVIRTDTAEADVPGFKRWIQDNYIETLNIAGPRESHAPGRIYSAARRILVQLLSAT